MPSVKLYHEIATESELIALCSSPDRETISSPLADTNVIKISDQAVIKFGFGISEEEANNLKVAFELLDRNIVRVPRFYRFFTKGDCGYIVMEYVKGQVLDPLEDTARIQKITRVLSHLGQIEGSTAGPLGGGAPRTPHGLLWTDHEILSFSTIIDVETYIISRLRKTHTKPDLQDFKLVMCHLDIAPRNILWLEDDSICLLDWASAGFYPRLFEWCGQMIVYGFDGKYNQILLDFMEKLSAKEEAQAQIVLLAWHNEQRLYCRVPGSVSRSLEF
ncbi:hypothetical protein MMC13_005426 [Lambiella insularis]|nr:hypothetical protein [Lambiella insularis]